MDLSTQHTSPEVYVVEHILKNGDTMIYFIQSFRAFYGRSPRTQNESDNDTYPSGAELLLKDPAISDLQGPHMIIDSLLHPAHDMVKPIKPETSPTVYLQILDSGYCFVQDGNELYVSWTHFKMQEKSHIHFHND